MKHLVLVFLAALALCSCSSEQPVEAKQSLPPSTVAPSGYDYIAEGETLEPTIMELPDIKGESNADPALIGFYNVSIDCRNEAQEVSFRINVEGEGSINVKAEEHKSMGAKTLYARQVVVNDENRDKIGLDLHHFTVEPGIDVFLQISGGGGMATSDDLLLSAAC